MNEQNINYTFTVDQTPDEVFAAINNVRDWWSGAIEGSTHELGGEFTYAYRDLHRSKQRITELTPGKRVVWQVLDGYLSFVANKAEWTGTEIQFDIAKKGAQTEVTFTHVGLVPSCDCYGACSEGWGTYVPGSLRDLITTGRGRPNAMDSGATPSRR